MIFLTRVMLYFTTLTSGGAAVRGESICACASAAPLVAAFHASSRSRLRTFAQASEHVSLRDLPDTSKERPHTAHLRMVRTTFAA